MEFEVDRDAAVDGRTARRDRNRVAVLDAVLELFAEGDLSPSPEDVARRSGVSLRSVYRYVVDREDLTRAAIDRHVERIGHLFTIPDVGHGSLGDRIEQFVNARVKLYEAIAATHRASRQAAPMSLPLRERLDAGRRAMREQLELQFAAELCDLATRERRNVAAAADALTQMENLDHLRLHCGFTARVMRDILVDAFGRLFGAKEQA